ncbi:hypothetical protein PS726_04964 [Pseudomonas fluorescens]|uniref:GNAT family N-acetyltransferase n=1 Tax=Pseudomonas fluorescens TaxID=294 RepID=UPI001241E506|nr:GNAT family N-acetyltransferase [Pseudomonas fluorescens]CAG8865232.1 hypothetical protein PS861_01019 [Pseudomonas fluorescens]VVO30702.1 hypothetical protein PS726_04964 [Pseudomonas fluorescens]
MPRERTHLRYQLYKSQARKIAGASTAQLQYELERIGPTAFDLSKVRFEPIDTRALNAFVLWEDPHFSWNEVVGWKAREPLALDIAIWFDDELCGMCFANPNNSRLRMRIVRLEGRPKEAHPLRNRIATLALIAIEQYAQLIGCRFLEVQEPLVGAVSIYQQLGFDFDIEGRLVKTLENLVS